jgi:hypothetical protein
LLTEGKPSASIRCFIDRAGFIIFNRLAALCQINEADLGLLNATARAFATEKKSPIPGLREWIAPTPRPAGYMANGSFHGELLSVHETRPVSLTH